MYQVYAYGKKYDAERVVLLYPNSEELSKTDIAYVSNDNVKVDVSFIDLRDADNSIMNILSQIC